MRNRMESLTVIGKRIQTLREARRLTRPHVARVIGISPSQLYKYERGLHQPPAGPVAKLAKLFEVSPDYLLGLTDRPQATYAESSLSAIERELLQYARSGDLQAAMERLLALSKETAKNA
jgi:transcriptional regulator with XRE-family HTH domain